MAHGGGSQQGRRGGRPGCGMLVGTAAGPVCAAVKEAPSIHMAHAERHALGSACFLPVRGGKHGPASHKTLLAFTLARCAGKLQPVTAGAGPSGSSLQSVDNSHAAANGHATTNGHSPDICHSTASGSEPGYSNGSGANPSAEAARASTSNGATSSSNRRSSSSEQGSGRSLPPGGALQCEQRLLLQLGRPPADSGALAGLLVAFQELQVRLLAGCTKNCTNCGADGRHGCACRG